MNESKKKTGAPAGNTNARRGDEPRSASVVMKIEPATKKRWKDHATEGGVTMVDMISDAVEDKINKDRKSNN